MTDPNLTSKVSNPGDSPDGIIRLLPCPFCGLTDKDTVCPESTVAAVHAQDYYAMSSVICEGCQTTGPSTRSRKQAIVAWNTRKIDAAVPALQECGECSGQGWYPWYADDGMGEPREVQEQCKACGGTGNVLSNDQDEGPMEAK